MTAAEIVAVTRSKGFDLHLRDDGKIGVRPPGKLPPELREAIVAERSAVIELLRADAGPAVSSLKALRHAADVSEGGKRCGACGRIDRGYGDDRRDWTCWRCAEWRIRGCPGFTVLETADVDAERERGACLACGAAWPMHGSPDPSTWTRVRDLDDVAPAATHFVLARAREIARGVAS